MKKIKISPSMMCADFINLKAMLDLFQEKEIEYLHIDVMDGHYVPNFTLGVDFCNSLAAYSSIPLDIHLMIENVDAYISSFRHLQNAVITFHPETVYHPLRTIQLIRQQGQNAGIAIDPSMPVESIRHLLPYVDMVCVMTVNPGYSGQKLIPESLRKIEELAEYMRKEKFDGIDIEADGNVSWENIPLMIEAGSNVLVAGTSSIFQKEQDLSENIDKMRKMTEILDKMTVA